MGKENKVYLSYAYGRVENNELIECFQCICKEEGFEFHHDSDRVETGDSFCDFMEEMEQADRVIILASPEYFKSHYCIYELIKIRQRGRLLGRVIPIWLEGVSVNDTSSIMCECQTIDKEKLEQLKISFGEIEPSVIELGDLKAIIFNPNLSQEEKGELREKIRKKILFPLPSQYPVQEGGVVVDDDSFKATIVDDVQNILKKHDSLTSALKKEDQDIACIAEALCEQSTMDFIGVLEDLYSALETLNHKDDYLIYDLKKLANMLVLLTVKKEWLDDHRSTCSRVMQYHFDSQLVASAIIAISRSQQRIPNLVVEKGNTHLWGKDEIQLPSRQAGWTQSRTVDEILLTIWRTVFPLSPKNTLTHKDYQTLDSRLIRLYKRNKKQHYISNSIKEFSYLSDRDYAFGIRKYLPSLLILTLDQNFGENTIIDNEQDVIDALRDFITDIDDSLE